MALPTPNALYEQFRPPERLVLLLEAMARADDAEGERIRSTCPRKTYSCPDAAFQDRYEMALDVTVVACGDLKALVAHLRVLAWVSGVTQQTGTAQQITATMAFLDGVQHGRGRPQTPFFRMGLKERVRAARRRKLRREGTAPDATTEAEDDDEEEIEEPGALGEEFYRRMQGVERRSGRWARRLTWLIRRAELDLAVEVKNIWAAYDAFCQAKVGVTGERMLEACGYPGRHELFAALERHKDVAVEEQSVAEYREGLCGFWDGRFAEEQ